jgi:hypothetical protein
MAKNKAAAELAAQRWKNTTAEERAEVGRELGQARWAAATKEERLKVGKRLAEARAKKRKIVKGKRRSAEEK